MSASPSASPARVLSWLRLVYASDVAGGGACANPEQAARMLADDPGLASGDAWLACATGSEVELREAVRVNPDLVRTVGGPLMLPPLAAVTHSTLVQIDRFKEGIHACARLLLESGADPNQTFGTRSPPASLESPADDQPLTPLYGAAGVNRDPDLTQCLLEAGADPNDGESLYHSLESAACTQLLLEAGAQVQGTNVFYRACDLDNVQVVKLLLSHGADPNEPARNSPLNEWGSPLLWAIRRRRSPEIVAELLRAGANASARRPDGRSAWKMAHLLGLPQVADVIQEASLSAQSSGEELSVEEAFAAACARGDEQEALRIRGAREDLPRSLPPGLLRLLPDLCSEGVDSAVRVMVKLGWPIEVRGGDWNGSALNFAVFRGDARLARFLLDHGASWTEQHGFGDNVCGTLSWASRNQPVDGGDWVGCASALLAHGLPAATPNVNAPGWVMIAGQSQRFSDDVTDLLVCHAADSGPDRALGQASDSGTNPRDV